MNEEVKSPTQIYFEDEKALIEEYLNSVLVGWRLRFWAWVRFVAQCRIDELKEQYGVNREWQEKHTLLPKCKDDEGVMQIDSK